MNKRGIGGKGLNKAISATVTLENAQPKVFVSAARTTKKTAQVAQGGGLNAVTTG
jgi:hypothetical protein